MAASDISNTVTGWFSASSVESVITTFLWSFGALIVIAIILFYIRDKIKYKYYGQVLKLRQNEWGTGEPSSKIIRGKAGYFKSKGLPIFRINFGPMPWQTIDIKKLPDPAYMQDETAFFLQYNLDEYVQSKMVIDYETNTIKVEPVDSTTKAGAKQDLAAFSKVFETNSRLQENMGIAVMGFVMIGGLIAYYFVNKACQG